MALGEITDVADLRNIIAASDQLHTFTPQTDSEIARYCAQFQQHIQTRKEFCA